MRDDARFKLGKGVKLRHDTGDGTDMLLVPEGALVLNRTAAVALALVDGEHTLGQIVDTIVERFDVTRERAHEDLDGLFERLARRKFITSFDTANSSAPARSAVLSEASSAESKDQEDTAQRGDTA